ncbi:hypothetical protein RSal33209_2945 [Renibacterium salmoninarum ATCC 33209]|uniref:Uncharacterized protein n=1 Tax=Renibacterium salmoninarum (strain ATCC 33209 / DSM 20767 / JCM 11484 / NBRC 15589 / NCIMB 2235) TaxID=288705 RepID=A9WTZ6_RENSM|nr:hypothetical protein RSal33209_2945 [Renibacterium salmoninarum ATCC 33209]
MVPPSATASWLLAPISVTRSIWVTRGDFPSRTFTCSLRSSVTLWPATTSSSPGLSTGYCLPSPGTQMMAFAVRLSTSVMVYGINCDSCVRLTLMLPLAAIDAVLFVGSRLSFTSSVVPSGSSSFLSTGTSTAVLPKVSCSVK